MATKKRRISSFENDEFYECIEPNIDIKSIIYGKPLYQHLVYNNINMASYNVKSSRLIPDLLPYFQNCNINLENISKISKDLTQYSYPHLPDPIKIAIYNNIQEIFDGTNSLNAIKNIMESNDKFDMNVTVNIYCCNSELQFNQITNKNIQNNTKTDLLIDLIKEKWPSCIKNCTGIRNSYRPYINKSHLYQVLHPIVESSSLTTNQIFQKIIEINNEISMMRLNILFGTDHPSNLQANVYNKANKKKFYLNLDASMNLDVWTNQLLHTIT